LRRRFAPGIGADTIVNFDPQHDTVDLSDFNIKLTNKLDSPRQSQAKSNFLSGCRGGPRKTMMSNIASP
jgi:hypothetical protein